jgi:hypothetical protein
MSSRACPAIILMGVRASKINRIDGYSLAFDTGVF